MSAVSRDELRRHLIEWRIAGDVATPRASNVANITKMLNRQWDYWFGLDFDREWNPGEVLKVLADRVGLDPDPLRTTGADRIDPERTLDALDAMAALVRQAARERWRVFVATGHPTGVLALHLAVASALRAAGCAVPTPGQGRYVSASHLPAGARVIYLGSVAMLTNGADLLHTHAAEPMQQLLGDGLSADLVIADHGWAGAAAQAGIRTIGLADTNDPALFVGAEEGKVAVAVPLDDNVPPAAYQPLADYVVGDLRPT